MMLLRVEWWVECGQGGVRDGLGRRGGRGEMKMPSSAALVTVFSLMRTPRFWCSRISP